MDPRAGLRRGSSSPDRMIKAGRRVQAALGWRSEQMERRALLGALVSARRWKRMRHAAWRGTSFRRVCRDSPDRAPVRRAIACALERPGSGRACSSPLAGLSLFAAPKMRRQTPRKAWVRKPRRPGALALAPISLPTSGVQPRPPLPRGGAVRPPAIFPRQPTTPPAIGAWPPGLDLSAAGMAPAAGRRQTRDAADRRTVLLHVPPCRVRIASRHRQGRGPLRASRNTRATRSCSG